MALVPGDQEVSEVKLKVAIGADVLEQASLEQAEEHLGPRGFIGPIGVDREIRVVADWSLRGQSGLITGANKDDTHWGNVDVDRDVIADFFDIKEAVAGDGCGKCGSPFAILRGIEVGHIFYLGQKYSKALNATIQNEHGEMLPMEMGCYGIGVGRTAAAAIEQNHDDKGIIWPTAIAPFQVHLVQLGVDADLTAATLGLYQKLTDAGIEVLWDDRDERAGVKLNDADLLGCPLRLTLGSRGLKAGEFEVHRRSDQGRGPTLISLNDDYIAPIKELL